MNSGGSTYNWSNPIFRNQSELVLIEYVMLHGVNDSLETAHLLGKLLYEKSVVSAMCRRISSYITFLHSTSI